MSAASETEDSALSQLQSQHGHLLDKIDELRTIGVGGLIELPQLIVCGDQSSGKSSVLEAISRVRFPTRTNKCTRFATEVSLRRLPVRRFKVSIEAGPSRTSEEDKEKLKEFTPDEFTDIAQLRELVLQAEKYIVDEDFGAGFSDDVLKIEISGPDQPELTLVDLPGLYTATSADQGAEGITIVRGLTERYMKNTRSIILAVISAKAQFNNQEILDIAAKFDGRRERTVGIITQPDELYAHSEEEESWLQIARNDKNSLKLGWHTLRNRSFETKDASDDERDQTEKEFFSEGNWSSVPRDCVGVDSLRQRLSSILLNHIRSNLPGLINDIRDKILEKEAGLKRLGEPRSTIQQQKGFLLELSSVFERVVTQALNGLYTDSFFGGLSSKVSNYRQDKRLLRAEIRQLNEYFAENIEARGCEEWIIDDPNTEQTALKKSQYGLAPHIAQHNPYEWIQKPKLKKRIDLEDQVAEAARQSRGIELPGSANQLLIGDLFRSQSKPWEKLAQHHLLEAWEYVNVFVATLLRHLTDERTYQLLMGVIISPKLDDMKKQLLSKLDELVAYNKRGHPLPLGNTFFEQVQKARTKRQESQLERKLLEQRPNLYLGDLSINDIHAATEELESSFNQFAAAEIIDQMQTYYEVTLTTFINNIAILAIENCLLEPLNRIFTSQTINNMDDSQVKRIAAEPASFVEERERLTRELEKLGAGLRLLSQFSTPIPRSGKIDIYDSDPGTQSPFTNHAQQKNSEEDTKGLSDDLLNKRKIKEATSRLSPASTEDLSGNGSAASLFSSPSQTSRSSSNDAGAPATTGRIFAANQTPSKPGSTSRMFGASAQNSGSFMFGSGFSMGSGNPPSSTGTPPARTPTRNDIGSSNGQRISSAGGSPFGQRSTEGSNSDSFSLSKGHPYFHEAKEKNSAMMNRYQSICFLPDYKDLSPEEIRLEQMGYEWQGSSSDQE